MELFNEDELVVIKDVFNKYDSDKSGYLTRKQFSLFLSKLGKHVKEIRNVIPETVEAVFAYIDEDSDEKLNFKEFCKWWGSVDRYGYLTGEKSQNIRKAYSLYKSHCKSGTKMTPFDYDNMMDNLGLEHNSQDFDFLDRDSNGEISFEEFCHWLNWF